MRGQAVTPYVLAFLHERSGGRTLEVNRRLAADNSSLAAEVAVTFAASFPSSAPSVIFAQEDIC